MKTRFFVLIFASLILLTFSACSDKSASAVSTPVADSEDSSIFSETESEIVFADKVFEDYTRKMFGKIAEPITKEDFAGIKQIEFDVAACGISYQPYGAENANFSWVKVPRPETAERFDFSWIPVPESSEDLKYFTDVEVLDIPYIPVKNLEFVKHMPNLKYLHSDDSPHNLSPLAKCPELRYLSLDFSQVTDISPLKKLKNLETVIDLPENFQDELKAALPNVEFGDYSNAPAPASSAAPN